MKEKLQNEVTKVKEQLENYLSESNRLIKDNERIIKGIKSLEKKEDKNMIKNLSYVSKINKTIKENKNLFKELMKNLKITFQEEKCQIIYEEYYFNGIPTPYNIEFKNITSNSLNISWKIDDNLNNINIDKNKIKFIIEMRKNKEQFVKIYEGNNTNYSVNNLNHKTIYEFRICSYYDDNINLGVKFIKLKLLILFVIVRYYYLQIMAKNF